MALSINIVERNTRGRRTSVIADLMFDVSYPTGGEPIAAADLGLTRLIDLSPRPTGALTPVWDEAAGTVELFGLATTTDVADTRTVLATARLEEVADRSDQSRVVIRAEAIGY